MKNTFCIGLMGLIPALGLAKPNVLFFLMDDLGGRDLSCYGSTFHESPNIDALADSGMRFTQAYASCPVCSPTRAAIMTGNWKLIEFYELNKVDLFDLESDPVEQRDLSKVYPEKTAALLNQLHQWQASVDAQMPVLNPAFAN